MNIQRCLRNLKRGDIIHTIFGGRYVFERLMTPTGTTTLYFRNRVGLLIWKDVALYHYYIKRIEKAKCPSVASKVSK